MESRGQRAMRQQAAAIIRPPVEIGLEEWAERNVTLAEGPRALERFSLRGYEYQRGIVESCALARRGDSFSRVVVPKGGQTTHTTLFGMVLPLYLADVHRRSSLIVQPDEAKADRFAKKLWSVIEASPELRAMFPGRQKVTDLASAQRIPVRVAYSSSRDQLMGESAGQIILDEFDRLVGCDGSDLAPWDTAEMAEARMRAFRRKGRIDMGTPEKSGRGIMARYAISSQGRFVVRCPRCERWQTVEMPGVFSPGSIPEHTRDGPSNVTWTDERPDQSAGGATFRCRLCLAPWGRAERLAMNASGEWVHHEPGRDVRGHHVSALYSVNVSAAEVAGALIRARTDPRAEREVFNQLGAVGHEIAVGAITESTILERVAPGLQWRVPPPGTTMLTAGIDIQGAEEPWTYVVAILAHGNDRTHVIEWARCTGDGDLVAMLSGRWGGLAISRALTDGSGNGRRASLRIVSRLAWCEPAILAGGDGEMATVKLGHQRDETPFRHWVIHPDLMLDALYMELLQVAPGAPGGIMFAAPPPGAPSIDEIADHFVAVKRQPRVTRIGEQVWSYAKRRPKDVDWNFAIGLAVVAHQLGPFAQDLGSVRLPQPGPRDVLPSTVAAQHPDRLAQPGRARERRRQGRRGW